MSDGPDADTTPGDTTPRSPPDEAARARHRRVRELFLAAGEVPDAERDAWLERACAGDEALRREVTELLGHESASTGFLEDGALGRGFSLDAVADVAAPTPAPTPAPIPPRIGPYAVERILAEGGMGVVYVARQESPRRTVALKVVRPGVVHETALRRLEHEAQVLGMLQHPGIAQVHEAGTADVGLGPQPWFAMELVEGRELLAAAREAGLDVRGRVELLASICDAVQHAHQKGVIHRDLKPDNILVTADGRPKIVDFGIARATDPDARAATRRTDAGQLLGTLPYMSPEQVRGELDVDTRADVYALGVVGFELLTGTRPVDLTGVSVPEAARRVCEQAPTPLGRCDPSLAGDLETILGKALEKAPRRRYDSAAELAADLRRWLAHQPVLARPPSALYLLSRFTRRNRAAVVVSVVGLASLVVALGFTIDYALERDALLTEKSGLVQDLTEQNELNASMSALAFDMIRAGAPSADGSAPELASLVERSAVLIDRHIATAFDEAAVTHYFAQQCRDAGFEAVATAFLARAHALRAEVIGPDAPETLATGVQLAGLWFAQGRDDEAWALIGKATGATAAEPEDVDATALAATLAWLRSPGAGERTAARREALDALGQRAQETFGSSPLLAALQDVRRRADPSAPADVRCEAAARQLLERLGAGHPAASAVLVTRAEVVPAGDDRAVAQERLLASALAQRSATLGSHHASVLDLRHRLAVVWHRLGDVQRAERALSELVASCERLLPSVSPERERYRVSWARALADAGRLPDAEWQLLRAWDEARLNAERLRLDRDRPPEAALALVALYDRWERPGEADVVLSQFGLEPSPAERAELGQHLSVDRPSEPWRVAVVPDPVR